MRKADFLILFDLCLLCVFAQRPSLCSSTKGLMWNDIGLNDRLFDMDRPGQVAKLVPTVLNIAKNPEAAKARALRTRAYIQQRQKQTMQILFRSL